MVIRLRYEGQKDLVLRERYWCHMMYILIGDDADVSDAQVHADLVGDPLSKLNGGADHLQGILLLLSLPGRPRAELRRSSCSGHVREQLVNRVIMHLSMLSPTSPSWG